MSLNSWLLASNAAFFALSSFALVASIAVFLLTRANDRAKDRELRRYQFEAAQTVARADATAETAKADAAKANEAASKANQAAAELQVRAGQLEKDAAEARLKQEELRQSNLLFQKQLNEQRTSIARVEDATAPRHLTNDQRAALITSVRAAGPNLVVSVTILNDAEAQAYGQEIIAALREAGVQVRVMLTGRFSVMSGGPTGPENYQYNLIVSANAPQFLKSALEVAGLAIAELPIEVAGKDLIVGLRRPHP